jgi:hypothetical protein
MPGWQMVRQWASNPVITFSTNISRATIYLKIVDGRVVRNMKGTKSFIRPQGNVVIRRYVSVEHSLGDFEFSLTSRIVG